MTFWDWLLTPGGSGAERAVIGLITALTAFLVWRIHQKNCGK
jgi:hypothetical protein